MRSGTDARKKNRTWDLMGATFTPKGSFERKLRMPLSSRRGKMPVVKLLRGWEGSARKLGGG